MIKQLLIFILLIGSVSALTLQAGDSTTFDLGQTYSYYSIVGNSSSVEVDIYQTGTLVTINLSKYSPTDSFEIVFFDEKDEVISSGGSGGTRIRRKVIYVDRNITDVERNIPETININDTETDIPITNNSNSFWMVFFGGINLFNNPFNYISL